MTEAGPSCWAECLDEPTGKPALIFHATDGSFVDEAILVLAESTTKVHSKREKRGERTTWIDARLTDGEAKRVLPLIREGVKRIEIRPNWASITFATAKYRDRYAARFEKQMSEILKARRHLNPAALQRARTEVVETAMASIG